MNYRALTSPLGKILLFLIILFLLVIAGTMGFYFLEEMPLLDSLYMTIITLSTVGFEEVRPLDATGRIFVIFLVIFGVIAATFTLSAIGQFILEGQLRRIMGRRKMQSKIKKLTNHFILAGYGRVGREVVQLFKHRKVPFIVIDAKSETIEQLDSENCLYVQGQATEDEVLITAGIEKARALISTLPDEADNVYLALTARHINPGMSIICRIDHPESEKKLRRAGADYVVSPHALGGARMAMASLRPNVVDFMQMTSMGESGLGIEEVTVPAGSRIAGKTLVESGIKAQFGVTVIGIKKPDRQIVINPPTHAVIEAGDVMLLVGSTQQLEELTSRMTEENHSNR